MLSAGRGEKGFGRKQGWAGRPPAASLGWREHLSPPGSSSGWAQGAAHTKSSQISLGCFLLLFHPWPPPASPATPLVSPSPHPPGHLAALRFELCFPQERFLSQPSWAHLDQGVQPLPAVTQNAWHRTHVVSLRRSNERRGEITGDFPNGFAGAFPEQQAKKRSCCTRSSTDLAQVVPGSPEWGVGKLGNLWVTGNCDPGAPAGNSSTRSCVGKLPQVQHR